MTIKTKPRVSVNKLAEYLYAKPARRRAILTELKFPQPFIVSRYSDARSAIKEYLLCGDVKILDKAIKDLKAKEPNSSFQTSDKQLSIEAIKKVKESNIYESIGKLTLANILDNKLVEINGVDISVNPDLVIRKEKGNKNLIGGLKINIGKAPMKIEAQQIAALMLEDFVGELKKENETIHHSICFSYDVFEDKLTPGSQSKTRRLEDVKAACTEILALWPTI